MSNSKAHLKVGGGDAENRPRSRSSMFVSFDDLSEDEGEVNEEGSVLRRGASSLSSIPSKTARINDSGLMKYELRIGDQILLNACGSDGRGAGLFTCDSLSETRQSVIVRTTADGSLEVDAPEGCVQGGAFQLVAAISEAEAAVEATRTTSRMLRHRQQQVQLSFGQPVLLRHALSGRFLCAGQAATTILSGPSLTRIGVAATPAEIHSENLRLTLLPPSPEYVRRGDALPVDACLGACTFRFVPTVNHGRSGIFTDDLVWLVTDAQRLVRAGISPPPLPLSLPRGPQPPLPRWSQQQGEEESSEKRKGVQFNDVVDMDSVVDWALKKAAESSEGGSDVKEMGGHVGRRRESLRPTSASIPPPVQGLHNVVAGSVGNRRGSAPSPMSQSEAAKQGTGALVSPSSKDLYSAIGNAVRKGIPLVTGGDAAACRRLYSSVAHEASSSRALPKHKELLKKALGEAAEQAPGERDIVACFVLRRAFNTVVADAASPEDYGGHLPTVADGATSDKMMAEACNQVAAGDAASSHPFDAFDSPLRFEADVSRVDLAHATPGVVKSKRGCFHWRLSLRLNADDQDQVQRSAGRQFLRTGQAVRIKNVESNALVWAPSAVHPLESDALRPRASAFQAVLHAIGDPSGSPLSQQQHQHQSRSRGSVGGGRGAGGVGGAEDASGTLPAVASFKGVFVVEALSGDRIDTPLEALQWGKPYRFRHLSSGAYLSVHLDSQKLKEEKEATALRDIDDSLEFGVALVFPPGARGRRQCPSGREASRGPLGASRADAEDGDDGEEDELSDFPVRKEGSLFSEAQEEELFNQATALRLVPAMLAAVSSSSSSSTPSDESFIRADASLGWLQATVDPQLLRAAAAAVLGEENPNKLQWGGMSYPSRGSSRGRGSRSVTVTLHDTRASVIASADRKRALQCMLPVANGPQDNGNDDDEAEASSSGSSLGSAPPVPLPGNEGLEREVAANRGLAFVRGRAAADVVQLQRVAPELVSIGRLGLVALRRLVAFESWLRHLDPAVLANVLADAEDKRPGVDFISRRPSLEAAALKASRPKLFPEAPFTPITELLKCCMGVLNGLSWPDQCAATTNSRLLCDSGGGGFGTFNHSGSGAMAGFAAASLACERAFGNHDDDNGDGDGKGGAPNGGAGQRQLLPAVLTRRVQSLMRETPLLATPLFVFRALRTAGVSNHLLVNEPVLITSMPISESVLKDMARGNSRSQLAMACGKFTGRRRLQGGYNSSWSAELLATALEWGDSRYAESLPSGRPSLLLQNLFLDNPELNEAVMDQNVANFLCGVVHERGMDDHTVFLLAQACVVLDSSSSGAGGDGGGSGGGGGWSSDDLDGHKEGVVSLTQDRVFTAWMESIYGIAGEDSNVIVPYFGLFFVRKPEKSAKAVVASAAAASSSSASGEDGGGGASGGSGGGRAKLGQLFGIKTASNQRDSAKAEAVQEEGEEEAGIEEHHSCDLTFEDPSLMLYGSERIFRLCVALDPPNILRQAGGSQHWCLSCHLHNRRHRHGECFGSNPLQSRSSMKQFVAAGKCREASAYHPNDPIAEDRLIDEVFQWCHRSLHEGTHEPSGTVRSEETPYVDLALLRRLSRTSPEHARTLKYLQAFLNLWVSLAKGDRTLVKEKLQSFFPFELLLLGINFFSLGHELRSSFARLLCVMYLGRYPHFTVPAGPSLRLIGGSMKEGDDEVQARHMRNKRRQAIRQDAVGVPGAASASTLAAASSSSARLPPVFSSKDTSRLLPTFGFKEHTEALHPRSVLSLEGLLTAYSCDLRAQPPPRNAGDDFVYRACPGKFELLTQSLLASLGDARLLALVGAEPSKWTDEHLNAMVFLNDLLKLMRQLADSGFLRERETLSALARTLFRLKDCLERDPSSFTAEKTLTPDEASSNFIRSALDANSTMGGGGVDGVDSSKVAEANAAIAGMVENAQRRTSSANFKSDGDASPRDERSSTTMMTALNRGSARALEATKASLEMMENPFAFKRGSGMRRRTASNGGAKGGSPFTTPDTSPLLNSVGFGKIEGEEEAGETKDVLAGSSASRTSASQLLRSSSPSSMLAEDDALDDGGGDEDLRDEVVAIAERRGLSLPRLGLTFGEGNATALLVHDEPRPERVADIVVEVERFTLGQGWHHSPKVVPFECATNSELANLYCLDVTSLHHRTPGAALSPAPSPSPLWFTAAAQSSSDVGRSRFGPGSNPYSHLGLPFPGGDGDVGRSLSTWQWLEPWSRMGAGYPFLIDGGDGDGKDDGSWEYSRAPPYDPAASWTPGPARFGHMFRRRHWRRRRERKGALNLCVELLREGWADLSSVRHAIRAAREFAHSEAERRQGERDAVRSQQREQDAQGSGSGSARGDGGMRGQDERTLDLGHLMRHVKALKPSGNLVSNVSEGENRVTASGDLPWLSDRTLLDLETFSVLLDMEADDDQADDDDLDLLSNQRQSEGGLDNGSPQLDRTTSQDSGDGIDGSVRGKAGYHLDEDKETQRLLDAEAAALLKKKQRGSGFATTTQRPLDDPERETGERARLLCFTEVVRLLNRLQDTASHVRCGALLTSFQDRFAPCSAASASVAQSSANAAKSASQVASTSSRSVSPKKRNSTSKKKMGQYKSGTVSGGGASGGDSDDFTKNCELDPRVVFLPQESNLLSWQSALFRFMSIIDQGVDPGLNPSTASISGGAQTSSAQSVTGGAARRNSESVLGSEMGRMDFVMGLGEFPHGMRSDGSPKSALEHRGDLRNCAMFVKRLHGAFTTASVEPLALLHRFISASSPFAHEVKGNGPDDPKHKLHALGAGVKGSKNAKDTRWKSTANRSSEQSLDMATMQWLLAGIGYYLTHLDKAFLLKHFVLDEVSGASSGGEEGTHESQKAQPFRRGVRREEQEDPIVRERRQVEAAEAARIAREAAAAAAVAREQRQVVALDAAKLLLCLDAVPPELEPVLSAQGVELFESMFREAGAPQLDAFSLASRHYHASSTDGSTARGAYKGGSGASSGSNNGGASKGNNSSSSTTNESSERSTLDPTGCGAGAEQALLSVFRTFDEAAQINSSGRATHGISQQAFSHEFSLAEQTLALLLRAFRTRQEFLGYLTATDVVDRPDVDSPDSVTIEASCVPNEVQRSMSLLQSLCSRMKAWRNGGSGGSMASQVKECVHSAATIFEFLTTTIIKRRRDAGGNTRASLARFQFTLANAGVAAAALQVIATPALWGVVDDPTGDGASKVVTDMIREGKESPQGYSVQYGMPNESKNKPEVAPGGTPKTGGSKIPAPHTHHQAWMRVGRPREVLVDTTFARGAASRLLSVLIFRAPEAVLTKLVVPHFRELVVADERLGDGESHGAVGAVNVMACVLMASPCHCANFPEELMVRYARHIRQWALRRPPTTTTSTTCKAASVAPVGGGICGLGSTGKGDHVGRSVDTLGYLRMFGVLLKSTPVPSPAVQAKVFRVLTGESVVNTYCDPHFQGSLAEEPGYIYRRELLESTSVAPPKLKSVCGQQQQQNGAGDKMDVETHLFVMSGMPRDLCVGPDHFALARHALGLRLLAMCCQGTHHGACVATLACARLLPLTTICSLLRELTAECIDPEAVKDLSAKHTLAYAKVRVSERKAAAMLAGAVEETNSKGAEAEEGVERDVESAHVQHDLLSVYRGVGLSVGPWGHTRVLSSLAFFLTKVYLTHAAAPARDTASSKGGAQNLRTNLRQPERSAGSSSAPGSGSASSLSNASSSSPPVWCLPALKNTEAHALLAWAVDCGGLVRSLAHKVRRHEVFSATAAGAESICWDRKMGQSRPHPVYLWPNLEDPATNSAESVRLVLGSIIPALSALYNLLRLGREEEGGSDAFRGSTHRNSQVWDRGTVGSGAAGSGTGSLDLNAPASRKTVGMMGAAHRKAWNEVYSSLSRLLVGPSSRQSSSSSSSCLSSSVRHLQRLCSAVSPCVRDDLDRDWLPCAWKLMGRLADDAMVDLDSLGLDEEDEDEEMNTAAAIAEAAAETDGLMDAGADEQEAAELQPVVDLAEVADFGGARVNLSSLYSNPDHHVASDIHSFGTGVSFLHSGGISSIGLPPEMCTDTPLRALFGRFGKLRSVIVRGVGPRTRGKRRQSVANMSKMSGGSSGDGHTDATSKSARSSQGTSDDDESSNSGDTTAKEQSSNAEINGFGFESRVSVYFDAVRGLTEHFTPGRELKILSEEEQLAQDPDGAGVDGIVNVELLCLPTGKVVKDFPVSRAERVIQILEHIGCQVAGGVGAVDLRLSVDGFEVTQNLRFGAILAWIHTNRKTCCDVPVAGADAAPALLPPPPKVVVTWTPAMAACRACDGVDPRFLATVATATLAAEARMARRLSTAGKNPMQRRSVFSALYRRRKSGASSTGTSNAASEEEEVAEEEVMPSLSVAPRAAIGRPCVAVLVEDSGIDSFWRGFVNACASSEAIAASIEAETKRLVAFVFDLPRLSGLQFTFPGVVFTLVQHARSAMTYRRNVQSNQVPTSKAAASQQQPPQPQQSQEDDMKEWFEVNSGKDPLMGGGAALNGHSRILGNLGHVCDLLQRLMKNAVPGTPLPLGVKWAGVRPPQKSPSSSSASSSETSGSSPQNHLKQRLGHRPVVDDKVREEVGPEETSRRQMQALMVECGAVELVVEVLGQLGCHTNCFRMALELGLAIFEGGNLHAQERLYGFLVRTQDFAFAASISDVVRMHARWHERRAAARAAMGLPHFLGGASIKVLVQNGGFLPTPPVAPVDVGTPVDSSVFVGAQNGDIVEMVLHLAQLLCEGHHRGLQNILRDCRGTTAAAAAVGSNAAFSNSQAPGKRSSGGRKKADDDSDGDSDDDSGDAVEGKKGKKNGSGVEEETADETEVMGTDSFATSWMRALDEAFSVNFIEAVIELVGAIVGPPVFAFRLASQRTDAFMTLHSCLCFLVEAMQGPNPENQWAVVSHGSGALVRCLNRINVFIVALHPMSNHADFTRLWGGTCFQANLIIQAALEGRPRSMDDPTSRLLYETVSPSAFFHRLDRCALLIKYLNKKRRGETKAPVGGVRKSIRFADLAKQAMAKEGRRLTFSEVMSLRTLANGLAMLPPAEYFEPSWQHDYNKERHSHTLMYVGPMMVVAANALHALEASLGGNRFNLIPLEARRAMWGTDKSSSVTSSSSTAYLSQNSGLSSSSSSSSSDAGSAGGKRLSKGVETADRVEKEIMSTDANENDAPSIQGFDDDDSGGGATTTENDSAGANFFRDTARSGADNGESEEAAASYDDFADYARQYNNLVPFSAGRRRYFTDSVLSIEVQFGPEHGLVQVFFPRPAVVAFLTEQQQLDTHEKLDYTLDDAQVLREFFRLSDSITDEIRHRRRLAETSFCGTFLNVTTNESFEVVPWVISMAINFILMVAVRRHPDELHNSNGGDSSFYFHPPGFENGVYVLGLVLLVTNFASLVSTVALQAPLLWAALEHRATDALSRELRLGPVRSKEIVRTVTVAFALPCAWVVGLLIARALLMRAEIDSQSPEVRTLLSLIAVAITIPFLRASRTVLNVRPFFLHQWARVFVFIYDTCTLEGLSWKLFFTIINIMALDNNPLLFSLQILSVLNFSSTLRNVVRAVRGPIAQLSMTCFFGILVIYIFMVIAFWAFPSDLEDNGGYYPDSATDGDDDAGDDGSQRTTMCSSMIACYAVFLVNGLLMGGGIGEFISAELGNAPALSGEKTLGRYLFDLAFFVVVTIGLLNLIFGIIIDTFSSLREKANEEKALMENKCTICGLTRQEFERREPGGWQRHYKHEHNVWSYYAYLVHLQTKPATEFTGLEDFVAAKVAQRSLVWLPRHRALALEQEGE